MAAPVDLELKKVTGVRLCPTGLSGRRSRLRPLPAPSSLSPRGLGWLGLAPPALRHPARPRPLDVPLCPRRPSRSCRPR